MRSSRSMVVAVSAAAVLAAGLFAPSVAGAGALAITGNGDFGDVTVGKYVEQTFTLEGESPAITVTGPATLAGTNGDEFHVTDDSCDSQVLDTGASCTVTVAAAPVAPGERDGQLVIPTDGGDRTLNLTMNGLWTNAGSFYPVATSRILDTRTGNGAPKGQVHQGGVVHLQVTGRGGVPVTGVSAVALNLTVTGPTSGGYVTAYPGGATKPVVSTINFPRAWTGANQVTVPVGSNGQVDLFNCCGSVSLIADVAGWYAKDDTLSGGVYGKTYQTVPPQRIYDSRAGHEVPLPPKSWIEFDMAYYNNGVDIYSSSMTAFVATVTALNAGTTGYITAYRPGTNPTLTSTLNFRPGVITPNLAIIRTAPCHESWCTADGDPVVRFYNGSSRSVDILIDAVGFYSDTMIPGGLRYRPLTPTRIIDTRIPLGTNKFTPASTHEVTAPSSVAGDDTYALSANVTAIKPTSRTFLTLWPKYSNLARPTVSELNPNAGATVAQATVTEVGPGNIFKIYNSTGSTDLAMDVSGSFEQFPPFNPTPQFAKGAALRFSQNARPAPAQLSRAGLVPPHREG
jgi:hypothetical protein